MRRTTPLDCSLDVNSINYLLGDEISYPRSFCSGPTGLLEVVNVSPTADHGEIVASATTKRFPFVALVLAWSVLSAVAQKNPAGTATSGSPFTAARNFLIQGDLARAREATLAGLKSAPKSVEGYDLLGIISMQQKEYDQALEAFQHALSLNPRSASTHNDLANCYAQQQKMDLAEKEYKTTLQIEAANPGANYNLGVVLLTRNQPEAAIAYFRKVVPPDLPTEMNLLRAYLRAQHVQTGLEYARQISQKGHDDASLHFSLGVVLADENQFPAAEHELEIADGLRPGNYEILLKQGQVSLHCKHYDKAENTLNRALRVKPDSVEVLETLGRAYIDQHRTVDAIQVLIKARKLSPKDVDVIFLLARASMLESYFGDAIPLLEEGIRIAPQKAELHAALGECYFDDGKVDKATQEFETVRLLDPTARPYAFLSFFYRYLGRFDEAKKCSLEGLKIDPHNSACLFNLGAILNKQGSQVEAEKYLTQALKTDPDYDQALVELASVKISLKKYEEAIPLLRHAVEVSRDPAPAYYKLATVERVLHRTDDSQRDFKIFQTLSRNPTPQPRPYQNLIEYAGQRESLPPKARLELDLKALQEQIKSHPPEPQDLYMLAETQMKLGHRDEAMKAVSQLEQLSGRDLRTELAIGVFLANYRLFREAIPHFELALAADPTSDEARYDLADACFHVRDYSRAFEVLQHVSAGARDDSFLFLLGDVESRIGRLDEALAIFRHAVEMNPDNDQYYLTLAMTYLRGGNTDEAERVLQQGLARVPNSGRIHWGLGVISVLKGNNREAEDNLVKATDLMPEWVSGFSVLGFFYSRTGQISKARETLERFRTVNSSGELDPSKIEQMLDQESAQNNARGSSLPLSPEARLQFLQVALTLADRDL
jgi:tetratricopeptide (TPR) repeat protein